MNEQSALQQRFEREQALEKARVINAEVEKTNQLIAEQEAEQKEAEDNYNAQVDAYNKEQQAFKNAERAYAKGVSYSWYKGEPEYKYLKEMYKQGASYEVKMESNYKQQQAELDKISGQLNISKEQLKQALANKENLLVTDESGKYGIMKVEEYKKQLQQYSDYAATQKSMAPTPIVRQALPFNVPVTVRPNIPVPSSQDTIYGAVPIATTPELKRITDSINPKKPYNPNFVEDILNIGSAPVEAVQDIASIAGKGTRWLVTPYAEYKGQPMTYQKEIPEKKIVLPYQQRGTQVNTGQGFETPKTTLPKSFETKSTFLGAIPKVASGAAELVTAIGGYTLLSPILAVKGIKSGYELATDKNIQTGEPLQPNERLENVIWVGVTAPTITRFVKNDVIGRKVTEVIKTDYKPQVRTAEVAYQTSIEGKPVTKFMVASIAKYPAVYAKESYTGVLGKLFSPTIKMVRKPSTFYSGSKETISINEEGLIIGTPRGEAYKMTPWSERYGIRGQYSMSGKQVEFIPEEFSKLPKQTKAQVKQSYPIMNTDNQYAWGESSQRILGKYAPKVGKRVPTYSIPNVGKRTTRVSVVGETVQVGEGEALRIYKTSQNIADITLPKEAETPVRKGNRFVEGRLLFIKNNVADSIESSIKGTGELKIIKDVAPQSTIQINKARFDEAFKKALPAMQEARTQTIINIPKKVLPKPKVQKSIVDTATYAKVEQSLFYGQGMYERTEGQQSFASPVRLSTQVNTPTINIKEEQLQTISTIQSPVNDFVFQDVVSLASKEELGIKPKALVIQQPMLRQEQILKIEQAQAQKQIQITIQKQTPKPNLVTTPTSRKLPKVFGASKLKEKSLISKVRQAFDVVIFKGGKEEVIAQDLPVGIARKRGVKEVLSTLRASFKLKPSGTTTIEDIEYKMPQKLFTTSKFDKNRYVQRKNTRFGVRSETKEAQLFRKQKKGKLKWF